MNKNPSARSRRQRAALWQCGGSLAGSICVGRKAKTPALSNRGLVAWGMKHRQEVEPTANVRKLTQWHWRKGPDNGVPGPKSSAPDREGNPARTALASGNRNRRNVIYLTQPAAGLCYF